MCISFLTICVFIWYLWSTIGGTDKPTSSLRWKTSSVWLFIKIDETLQLIQNCLFASLEILGWYSSRYFRLSQSYKNRKNTLEWCVEKLSNIFKMLWKTIKMDFFRRDWPMIWSLWSKCKGPLQMHADNRRLCKKSAKIRLRPIESANQVPKQGFH